MPAIIIRYAEIALKRRNRLIFEQQLQHNLKGLLWRERQRDHAVQRIYGRMIVTAKNPFDERFLRLLALTPGLRSFSVAELIDARDPAGVLEAAAAYFERTRPRDRRFSFCCRVKRGDKRFPIPCGDFEREVAERVLMPLREEEFTVDLDHPDYRLEIDLRPEGNFILHERTRGAGGLPIGSGAPALALLSGGIDSPVASYLIMRRGCAVDALSFLSPPYTGVESETKLADLATKLAVIQGKTRLHIAPFTRIQEAVRDNVPDTHRTLVYRRFMFRIANRLADANGYGAFVTGESLGQVASQTVENMTCIGAAAERLVLRPLVGTDKEDIILVAKQIGSYEISIQPHPDTCSLFTSGSPATKARLKDCLFHEERLPVDDLVREAFDNLRVIEVGP